MEIIVLRGKNITWYIHIWYYDAKFYERKQKLENSHQLKIVLMLSVAAFGIIKAKT